MNLAPTERLIDQAIKAAKHGRVRRYLADSAGSVKPVNERTLRNHFAVFTSRAQKLDVCTQAYGLMRSLNGLYRTRYSIEKISSLSPLIYAAIRDRHWWRKPPARIADASESEVQETISIVPAILKETAEANLDRPYSLVTKFLHFSFPDTFGIYDARAASSIQTWAYFSFPLSNDEWKQFACGAIANPDGSGYGAVLEFYRLCWACAGDKRLADLSLAAQELSRDIEAPVSPLYVIDNLLWHSSGDPRALGLL